MTRTTAVVAPPLTLDDLIDLHFMLEVDDLFLQLMAAGLPMHDVGC